MLVAAFFSRGRFGGRVTRAAATVLVLLVGGVAGADEPATNVVAAAEEPAYVPPQEAQMSPRELWNRGYDFWKAGDTTIALMTLEPLMLSRTHGPRAAEIVGALRQQEREAALAQAKGASDVNAADAALAPLRRAVKAAEESAAAMQIALRAQPDDPRANRNFTRAVAGLQELRDELHVQDVLAQAKGKDPTAALTTASHEALAILKAQQGVLTNEAARAIAESESLAARTEKLADALIPLKQLVLQSITNEQQAATIVGDVEATRDVTTRAAEQLADLSADAATSLSQAETAFHRYWKGVVDPPAALAEGLRAQTNAVTKAERENGRDWQQEAAELSQAFGAKFETWAQQACAQDASMASNQPPFTAEVAQRIATAMREIEKKQSELVANPQASDPDILLAGLSRVENQMGLVAGQPPQLNAAGILNQTNAYNDVKRTDGFDWQKDALDTTRAFRAKFPAWAQQKAQEIQQKIQQGNTNAVPFAAEQQEEITRLAAEVETMQGEMVKAALPPRQLEILEKLARIRELLPKDDGGSNNQQQQQQQQDQNKDQQQDPQDQQQDPQDQQQEDKPQDKEQAQEPQDQKDVEDLLRKVQERSDEHENEKKARLRNAPLSPNDRDW